MPHLCLPPHIWLWRAGRRPPPGDLRGGCRPPTPPLHQPHPLPTHILGLPHALRCACGLGCHRSWTSSLCTALAAATWVQSTGGPHCVCARVPQTPTGPVVCVPWENEHNDCPQGKSNLLLVLIIMPQPVALQSCVPCLLHITPSFFPLEEMQACPHSLQLPTCRSQGQTGHNLSPPPSCPNPALPCPLRPQVRWAEPYLCLPPVCCTSSVVSWTWA